MKKEEGDRQAQKGRGRMKKEMERKQEKEEGKEERNREAGITRNGQSRGRGDENNGTVRGRCWMLCDVGVPSFS